MTYVEQIINAVNKNIEKYNEQLIKEFEPTIRDWSSLSKAFNEQFKTFNEILQKHHEFLKTAFSKGISNFDSPELYKPEKFLVDPRIIEQLCGADGPHLSEYFSKEPFTIFKERYDNAFDFYLKDRNMILPIFVFISIQDGLMTLLCEFTKAKKRDKYYHSDEKIGTLLNYYGSTSYIIEPESFEKNFSNFLRHRNEIMHGGKHAHFDKNLATISFLFLTFTFYIVTRIIMEKK